MYAIVDIETTGGYADAHGITEISIHVFDGNQVTEKFETLVNPGLPIPRYIQAMTGITDEMVAGAPAFEEVAPAIYNLLTDKIFVAHNVNFDYSFVKGHLERCGFTFNSKKLCTVRLSRKILPGFPSYSLGNLCHSLGIPMYNRHRAGGDTEATVQLFKKLLEEDKDQFIHKSLLRNSKEHILPPNVPKEHFDQLPYTPGVYYFHDQKGKIIYVGKARNVRYRVNSHFSNNSQSRQKQNFLRHVHAISCQPCATELMACVLESTEIKKLWPIFNYSQKSREDTYGIFAYEDQNGYIRLAIEKNKKQLTPVCTFHRIIDGHDTMRRIIKQFHLCPKLCFMQTGDGKCEGIKEACCYGACENKEDNFAYNERIREAIEFLQARPSFAIIEDGLNENEQSCVLVIRGKFYGMGYIPADVQVTEPGMIQSFLTPYKENGFISNLINSYAAKFPAKVRVFEIEVVQSSH
ncbi:MAG: exonuclease domain-containing protein [Bacteroidota bacterium]|nr:exonuclease domain-containing protein [Bacteroidota bacterium]